MHRRKETKQLRTRRATPSKVFLWRGGEEKEVTNLSKDVQLTAKVASVETRAIFRLFLSD